MSLTRLIKLFSVVFTVLLSTANLWSQNLLFDFKDLLKQPKVITSNCSINQTKEGLKIRHSIPKETRSDGEVGDVRRHRLIGGGGTSVGRWTHLSVFSHSLFSPLVFSMVLIFGVSIHLNSMYVHHRFEISSFNEKN